MTGPAGEQRLRKRACTAKRGRGHVLPGRGGMSQGSPRAHLRTLPSAGSTPQALKTVGMSASQLPTARKTTATLREPAARPAGAPAETSRLVLGRYHLQRRLGSGAFGAVWSARDQQLDRDVAVKIVPNDRVLKGRFEREAQAAARLSHPAIVTLFEAATDEHDAYLVSELVLGGTLEQLLQAGRLSDRDILQVALCLSDALAHAHAHGIIHRDVKPSNVLIPERPSSDVYPAKLTDFGVARVLGGDSLTRTGEVIGTAAYMAPEQAEGRDATAAVDLYALALVTYEALTGVNPVRTNTAAIKARRLGAHLPPLRRQRRDLPHDLGRAIDQALRPRPRERGTLEELRTGLLDALEDVDDRPGIVAPPWRPRRAAQPEAEHAVGAEAEWGAEAEAGGAEDAPSAPVAWPSRALGAAAAAVSCAWLAAHALPPSTLAPAVAGAAAGFAVLPLPRIGWLASTSAVAALAAVHHRPGAALLILIAALIPAVVLPRRGTAWSLAAGAPALGLIGLAGAWPAIAASTRHVYRRAALGAIGWLWLLLASPLASAALYPKQPALPSHWYSSISITIDSVLRPVASSGLLLAAPVWALSAAVLPFMVHRRSLPMDLVFTVIWSAVTVACTEAAMALGHHAPGTTTLPTAAAGAIAAGAIALAPTLYRFRRQGRQAAPGRGHSPGYLPELP